MKSERSHRPTAMRAMRRSAGPNRATCECFDESGEIVRIAIGGDDTHGLAALGGPHSVARCRRG